ncbi:MAG: DUF1553 domain-containing protein [Planctomycetota bacterium]|nr:DUF1553 domain-containing protein [Planctomycetota bacterium]MDA1212258.1 DUF1553 domain-containing protein [Planctomycetota bacterium]
MKFLPFFFCLMLISAVAMLPAATEASDAPPDPAFSPLQGDDLPDANTRPLSFVRDVIPALTKAGCNAGACHGSFQGRGGFQLSLWGFDPPFDFDVLVKSSRGRRVSPASPQRSLLLQKGTGSIPHGGGRRISRESEVYRILYEYIAQGVSPIDADEPALRSLEIEPSILTLQPSESISLRVTAHWSDGTKTDVTPWASFDSNDPSRCEVSRTGTITAIRAGKCPVTVRYMGQVTAVDVTVPFATSTSVSEFEVYNFIDEHIRAEWQRVGLTPVGLCSDGEFIRRASLDLIGTLPTLDETRAFLASTEPDKRRQLIDRLLERPEYAEYWGLKWGDLLRVHRRYIGDKGLASFSGWIKQSLRENRPLDQFTREILTAQGNVFKDGPVAYFFIDEKPEDLAETTAQVFLGVRMQCTRCHHHPFEVWEQDDYYGLAAFFTQLEIKQPQELGNSGRYGGTRILRWISEPSPQRTMKVSAQPHVLGGASPVPNKNEDLRVHLADWMTSPENPYFSRNFVNRYWAYLMGRGLVMPVDDLRASNPASHPALFDELARQFAEQGFDLKWLLRTICQSHVYQLSMNLNPEFDHEGQFYTCYLPRRLSAEVLLDAMNQATQTVEIFDGMPSGFRAISLPDPTIVSSFLDTFGRPNRSNACECARNGAPDLAQALNLLNGTAIQQKVAAKSGRLAKLLESNRSDAEIVEELYLVTMSRQPTADEERIVTETIAEAPSRQEAWEDIFWSLLNCSEFVFQH